MPKALSFIFALTLLVFFAIPAQAEDFVKPNWPDLARTMVRFNALDPGEDILIDEYAMITECPMYQAFYGDDFKWNKVRGALREDIRNQIALFPVSYGYPYKLQLDRYDFKEKLFSFSPKTPIRNVNSFVIYKTDGLPCGDARVRNVPKAFRALLDAPVFIPGLPMAAEDANALLERMKSSGNNARTIYGRFNIRVVYIEPLRRFFQQNPNDTSFLQGNHLSGDPLQLDSRLDSVDFFEDEAMTKLIYSYRL